MESTGGLIEYGIAALFGFALAVGWWEVLFGH